MVSLAILTSKADPNSFTGAPVTTKKYESEAAKTSLVTPPESARNLRLDHATPNSLVVKWDVPEQVRARWTLVYYYVLEEKHRHRL